MVYLVTFLRDPLDYFLSNGMHSSQKENDSYCVICMESHSHRKISTRSFFAKKSLVAALQHTGLPTVLGNENSFAMLLKLYGPC